MHSLIDFYRSESEIIISIERQGETMADKQKIEIVKAPNTLQTKVGGKLPAVDEDAIARAEKALENLKTEFAQWIDEDIEKLDAARKAVAEQNASNESVEHLKLTAHDLKGLGQTYDFPLVARLASSWYNLLENLPVEVNLPKELLDAHVEGIRVEGIRAMVRHDVRETTDKTGVALATELEELVSAAVSQ